MYTGSFGVIANQEDWTASIALLNDDGTSYSVTGATIVMFLTDPENTSSALISATTADSSITIAVDGSTFGWTIDAASLSALCPGDYSVFARMTLASVTTQLVSAAITIADGGPSS